MNQPIVSLLGNSVPLLIQPFRTSAVEKTYAEHLRAGGFTIVNGAKQSAIVSDLYYYLEDECIRHFPDYVILNFGIVEATYRTRPRWWQNVLAMNAWNNSVIRKGYNGPVTRGIKFVAKKIYRKLIERPLFALGLKGRWLKPNDFQFILRDIIKRIFSDTPAKKIIVIGMLPVAAWVEKQAPGTNKSIAEYNTIMASLAKINPNCLYLDPQTIIGNREISAISQDGIHFTALGHSLLAEAITPLLQGEREDYTGWEKINQYENLYRVYENWFKRKTSRPE